MKNKPLTKLFVRLWMILLTSWTFILKLINYKDIRVDLHPVVGNNRIRNIFFGYRIKLSLT